MKEINTNHWTTEQKVALDNWLKISIEMIEKYCVNENDNKLEFNENPSNPKAV